MGSTVGVTVAALGAADVVAASGAGDELATVAGMVAGCSAGVGAVEATGDRAPAGGEVAAVELLGRTGGVAAGW
jgi:hypothetical protein